MSKKKNPTAGIIRISDHAGGVGVQVKQIRASLLPKTMDYGGDMQYCIVNQCMITLDAPAKPGLLVDQYQALNYRVEKQMYVKEACNMVFSGPTCSAG